MTEKKGSDELADEVIERVTEKMADKAMEKVADKALEKMADKPTEKMADKATEKVADKTKEKPGVVDTIFSTFIAQKMKEIEAGRTSPENVSSQKQKQKQHRGRSRRGAEADDDNNTVRSDRGECSSGGGDAAAEIETRLPSSSRLQSTTDERNSDARSDTTTKRGADRSPSPAGEKGHKRKKKKKEKHKHKSKHHGKEKRREKHSRNRSIHRSHRTSGSSVDAATNRRGLSFEDMHDLELEEAPQEASGRRAGSASGSSLQDGSAAGSQDGFWRGADLLPSDTTSARQPSDAESPGESTELQSAQRSDGGTHKDVQNPSLVVPEQESDGIPPDAAGCADSAVSVLVNCSLENNAASAGESVKETLQEDVVCTKAVVLDSVFEKPDEVVAVEKTKNRIKIQDLKLSSVVLSTAAPSMPSNDDVTTAKAKQEDSSDTDGIVEDTDGEISDSHSEPDVEKEGEAAGVEAGEAAGAEATATPSKKHKHGKKHKHKSKKRRREKEREGERERHGKRSHSREHTSARRRRSQSPRQRHRTRSRSPQRRRGSRSRSSDRRRSDGHSEPRGVDVRHPRDRWRHGRHSRSPVRDAREHIDKARLLKVAKQNLLQLQNVGALPEGLQLPDLKPEQMAMIQAGGKTVQELTEVCRQLVRKEGELSSSSDSSPTRPESDEEEGAFIHHPFKLRENNSNILMLIRGGTQKPTTSNMQRIQESVGSQLRLTFPVSSGSQHRQKELEWVPVDKAEEEERRRKEERERSKQATAAKEEEAAETKGREEGKSGAGAAAALMPPPPPPPVESTVARQDKVFSEPPTMMIDVGSVVAERLAAMRKLQHNPNDVEAMNKIHNAQAKMQSWVESKQLPGQFVGSTGVSVLSPSQLGNNNRTFQAWAKKDQFQQAAPLRGGMGMYLLQKMGWKQGEGLGKNKSGNLEPLVLDVKTDRRGLVAQEESGRKHGKAFTPPVHYDLSGKHPVSALTELCTKRKWGQPTWVMHFDGGPDHNKNFLFKVVVNGIEYQPTVASPNKKHAKAQAGMVCLQALGLLPRNATLPV